MAAKEILLLGNDTLYRTSREIAHREQNMASQVVDDLRDTLIAFRNKYHFGRAIAAPQVGELVRIIYMNFTGKEYALINPRLEFGCEEFEVWDDCMSFPGLEVKVKRFREAKVFYKDLRWNDCVLEFADDLAELIQHEFDHLDGILAVQKAIDAKSFRINKQKSGTF